MDWKDQIEMPSDEQHQKFMDNLEKAGKKNYAKLTKKVIINTKGKRQTVYVETNDKPKESRLRKQTVSYEEYIISESGNKYEMGVAFDEKGDMLFSKIGEKSRIEMSAYEMIKLKGASVFTHNHPNSRCFSIQDLLLSINSDVKQMRAIASKSLKGNITWVFEKGNIEKSDLERFKTEYLKEDNRVHNAFEDKIYNDEMTIEEAESEHHYKVLTNVMSSIYWRSKKAKFYWDKRD